MTVLKPRSRMMTLRLSEEEYSALKELCSVTGARSVSDIARDAMRAFLNGSSGGEVGARLEEFRAQMRNMDQRIEQLAAELALIQSAEWDKSRS